MKFIDLGKASYASVLELQMDCLSNYSCPTVILCEHDPPVYTAGKRLQDFENSQEAIRLRNLGAECHSASRGGLLTWHGLGQLVAYPILDIAKIGMRVYVGMLEKLIINTASAFGVPCEQMAETGVVTSLHKRKFGFIGVAQSHGISYHGLSINVNNDLSWFSHIVPCGIANLEITSLYREISKPISVDSVKERLQYEFNSINECLDGQDSQSNS